MKFRFFSIFLILAILCGCGQSAAVVSDNDSAKEEAGIPVTGGTLRLAMKKPETLNPLLNRDDSVDKVLRLIFEPLFTLDSEMHISPDMAEGYTLSNGGRTVTIKLKEGMLWQDGAPVTADDIVYSVGVLKRAAGDAIYKGCIENVISCSKTEELTAVINYDKPMGIAGYSLCFPIIPAQYYKKGNVDMYPLGSGFYKFKDYTLVKEMNLTASDSCFRGKPYITNVNVKIMPDKATQLQALSAGVIDCVSADINELGSLDGELGKNAHSYNTNHFEYIGVNTKKAPFSNVSARQAIACALSPEDIISDIYINKATASFTPIDPNYPYYSDVGMAVYENDSNMVNALISAGGLTKNDFTFTILVNSENSARMETARMLSAAFNENGFNTKVEAVSFQQYTDRLSKGSFDMFIGGVRLKENMDLSQLVGTDGAVNYGRYSNSNVDKLIAACNNAADEESYKRALSELNKALSTELPLIGIGFEAETLVTDPHIKGLVQPSLNNLYGNIDQWYIQTR